MFLPSLVWLARLIINTCLITLLDFLYWYKFIISCSMIIVCKEWFSILCQGLYEIQVESLTVPLIWKTATQAMFWVIYFIIWRVGVYRSCVMDGNPIFRFWIMHIHKRLQGTFLRQNMPSIYWLFFLIRFIYKLLIVFFLSFNKSLFFKCLGFICSDEKLYKKLWTDSNF